eukprot:scaffold630_cov399-Prasinococcus_capsulatus_cf.AAC.5
MRLSRCSVPKYGKASVHCRWCCCCGLAPPYPRWTPGHRSHQAPPPSRAACLTDDGEGAGLPPRAGGRGPLRRRRQGVGAAASSAAPHDASGRRGARGLDERRPPACDCGGPFKRRCAGAGEGSATHTLQHAFSKTP